MRDQSLGVIGLNFDSQYRFALRIFDTTSIDQRAKLR